jgi:hypothetical protein
MFLQNLYVWKPFRAVAAAMLVLVMATACQETAQQITQPSAKASVALTETTQGTAIAQNAPLSEAELALVKKMEGDKDVAAMNLMQKTIIFKMKIAIGHDKEGFKQAILNKDSKRFVELMNFSESEYAEFNTKLQQHLSNFKTRYAADMSTLENLKKRTSTVFKTSQGASPNSNAAALDEQFAIIEKANVGSMDKIQVFDEFECQMNRPWIYAQYVQSRTNIGVSFLIGLPIASAGGPIALGIFLAGIATSIIVAQCNTCGCPW